MKTKLQTYDNYKNSGVEWLGKIPEHWEIKRFKHISNIQKGKLPKKIVSSNDANLPPYMSMEYLRGGEENQWVFDKDAKVIDENKTLLLWDGSNAGEFIKSRKGVISSTVAEIEFKNIHNNFAWFYSKFLEIELRKKTIGMGIPHVNGTELKNFSVAIPPLKEQTAIANFLDDKTTKIDQAIAIKQKQIELLKERRQILIHKAVTRGLNDNVKLKDIGVQWIGEIPEHWEVKALKFCTNIFRGKFTHRPRNDERLYDGDYPFFQTGDVAKAGKYLSEYRQTLNNFGLRVSTLFPKGTIVMTIAANIGDISILNIDACFPDSIVGFRPVNYLEKDFLYNSLLVMKEQFMSSTIKNTQMNLNVERIGTNAIAIPSIEEQKQIVAFIETATTKIATAISLKEQEIGKLKEYKMSLIDGVVTGKVKVC